MSNTTQTPDADVSIINATFQLALRREDFPELHRAEARARLELAAAVIAMDAKEDRIAAGELVHSLHEQAEVESAKEAYAQALADLIRGEAGSSVGP